MIDPWAVQEENGKRIYFAQCRIEREEKPSKNGSYFRMTIFLTPIEPELQITEQKCLSFSPDWQQVTVPSVMALVADKKLTSPADMEQEQYISYRWTEFKSRAKNDIKYWSDKDSDRIGTDPHGQFVIKRGIEFLDVYSDQATWQQAAESDVDTHQPELPITEDEPPQPLRDSLITLIGRHFPNLTTLQENVLSIEQYAKFFSLQDDFVKGEVARLVAVKTGQSLEEREKLLAEVNSHFFDQTPYLKIDSPELVKHLGEIAF